MPKPRINIAAINAVLRNRRSSDDKSRKAALLDKFIETDAEEQLLQQAQEAAAAKVEAGTQDGGAPLSDGIELTTTPAAPPLTSAEALEARLARLEEQQLRILSLLEAKLK